MKAFHCLIKLMLDIKGSFVEFPEYLNFIKVLFLCASKPPVDGRRTTVLQFNISVVLNIILVQNAYRNAQHNTLSVIFYEQHESSIFKCCLSGEEQNLFS